MTAMLARERICRNLPAPTQTGGRNRKLPEVNNNQGLMIESS
jgi:hypothetical protein